MRADVHMRENEMRHEGLDREALPTYCSLLHETTDDRRD